ncbi:MAG: hypothetical protein N3H30_00830 [Candidatus Micrarchaeota archaeon]|nr:hypothetical protein [Candidatus Micrarchaeota archaeon]
MESFKQKEKDEKRARDLYLSFNLRLLEDDMNFNDLVSRLAGAKGEIERKAAEIKVREAVAEMIREFAREKGEGVYSSREIQKAIDLVMDDLKKEARDLSPKSKIIIETPLQIAGTVPTKKKGYLSGENVKDFQIAYNYLVEEKLINGELLKTDGIRGPKTMKAEEEVRKFLKDKGITVKGNYANLDKAIRKWNDEQGKGPIETATAKSAETTVFIPKLAKIYASGQLKNVPLEEEQEKERQAWKDLNEKRISAMIGKIRLAIKEGNKEHADELIKEFKGYALTLKGSDPDNFKAAKTLLKKLEPDYAKFKDEKKMAEEEKEPSPKPKAETKAKKKYRPEDF